jgi:hypothetical protein
MITTGTNQPERIYSALKARARRARDGLPGSAGASAAARSPTRRNSRRRGRTRRRRTRSPACAGTWRREIKKPVGTEPTEKKRPKKRRGRKNADCSLDGGEARSTNPAASMAAANGRERRPEPGGHHGGVDGAAPRRWSAKGEERRDRKTPLARGDLSPALRPGPVHSSLPAIASTWAPGEIGRDGGFRGGPPVSGPRTGSSPREYRTRLAYLFLLFGDDDWRRRRLGFRSQFRLPTEATHTRRAFVLAHRGRRRVHVHRCRYQQGSQSGPGLSLGGCTLVRDGVHLPALGLVHFPIPTQNISSSTHHIKSFDACMEH